MRRHSIKRPRGRTLGVIVGLAVLASIGWLLAAASATQPSGHGSGEASAPGTAAMRVAIQPETGDLVPAPVGSQVDDLGLPKPEGDLVVRTRPDGGLHADIRGHFMSYSVGRVAADGRVEETCVSDPREARALLQSAPPAPVAPLWEEK